MDAVCCLILTMLRPIPNSDGSLIASLTSGGRVQITVVDKKSHLSATPVTLSLGSSLQNAIKKSSHLRWAPAKPSDYVEPANTQLLLVSVTRVIVFELQVHLRASTPVHLLGIKTDVEFPVSLGTIVAADFVFDDEAAILVFDLAPAASILSLNRAQRDDIPNRKFASSKTYALSARTRGDDIHVVLALLVREGHTDYVAVLEAGQLAVSFKLDTIDAQEVLWSPNAKPVLMVRDAAAYGMNVKFFSPLGHPLRQITIGPESSVPKGITIDFAGSGIAAIDWFRDSRSTSGTLLALGTGSSQIHYCALDMSLLAVKTTCLVHSANIHGAACKIWHQISDDHFELVTGHFEVGPANIGEVELLSHSYDGLYLASKLSTFPNALYIWKRGSDQPTALMLSQHPIRQAIWVGSSFEIIVVTANTSPCFLHWRDPRESPTSTIIPSLKKLSSKRWEARLLCPYEPGDLDATPRLLVSSSTLFDIVRLDQESYPSIFTSTEPELRVESPLDLTSTTNEAHENQSSRGRDSISGDGTSIFF